MLTFSMLRKRIYLPVDFIYCSVFNITNAMSLMLLHEPYSELKKLTSVLI